MSLASEGPIAHVRLAVLDRDAALPLWAQLLSDLRARLERNEFGDAFPGELELAADYGVSRNAVREAVRRLRADGTVVAGRGRRPRPAGAAEIEQPVGALYGLFAAVEAAGLEQRSVVRALEVRADASVARRFGAERSTPLLYLERLRYAGEEPLALDKVWFPADLASPLLAVDFRRTGFYDELASRVGVRLTGGEERIRAAVPDSALRRLLHVGTGVAVLTIERLGVARDRRVEWRETLVRGDRFAVVAHFSAGSGYRVEITGDRSSSDAASA